MCQKSSRLVALQAVPPPALRHNPSDASSLLLAANCKPPFVCFCRGFGWGRHLSFPNTFHLTGLWGWWQRLKGRACFACLVGTKTGTEAAYSVLVRCWTPPRTAPSYKRLHSRPVRLSVGISYGIGHQICGAHNFITGRRDVPSLSENCSLGKVFWEFVKCSSPQLFM